MLARVFQRPMTVVTVLIIIAVASLATTVLWSEPVWAETVLHVYLAETNLAYVAYMQDHIIPEFERLHPHIQVELQLGVWDIDPILVRYAADAAPDVIQISSDIANYQHIVLPLNDFTANWDDLNDFPPVVLDAVTMDGDLLAIPFHLGTRSLAYRKDMFAQAGLDPEQPPTTWEELALFGKQLTRNDSLGEIIVQGFATGADYLHFAPFLFQAGGQFMSDDLAEITFADDAGLEAIAFMSDLYHAHRLSSPTVGDFKAGGAAMEYVSPIYFFPGYIDEFPNEDIGIALPLGRNRQTQILMPNSWAIVNTTPHREAAWAWIEFVSSLDAIIGLKRASGLVPPRLSVIHYEPWNEDIRWRTTFEGVSMSMTGPVKSPYFHHIRNHFVTPALQRVLYEEQSPAVAFEEEQRRAQTWLDEALGIPPPPRW